MAVEAWGVMSVFRFFEVEDFGAGAGGRTGCDEEVVADVYGWST